MANFFDQIAIDLARLSSEIKKVRANPEDLAKELLVNEPMLRQIVAPDPESAKKLSLMTEEGAKNTREILLKDNQFNKRIGRVIGHA